MLQDTPQLRNRLASMAKSKTQMTEEEFMFYMVKIIGWSEQRVKTLVAINKNKNANLIVD